MENGSEPQKRMRRGSDVLAEGEEELRRPLDTAWRTGREGRQVGDRSLQSVLITLRALCRGRRGAVFDTYSTYLRFP